MTEKAKEARREYMRQYRKNNRERIREIQKRYWERKAQQAESVPARK